MGQRNGKAAYEEGCIPFLNLSFAARESNSDCAVIIFLPKLVIPYFVFSASYAPVERLWEAFNG
jgi:hypothetical protein